MFRHLLVFSYLPYQMDTFLYIFFLIIFSAVIACIFISMTVMCAGVYLTAVWPVMVCTRWCHNVCRYVPDCAVTCACMCLMVVLATSCLSVLSSVLVLSIHHQRGRPRWVPDCLRVLVFWVLTRVVRVRTYAAPSSSSSSSSRDKRRQQSIVRLKFFLWNTYIFWIFF